MQYTLHNYLDWRAIFRISTLKIAIVFYLFPVLSFAAKHTLVLPANLQQGSLVVGHTEPGTAITYAGRSLRVSADGIFVFGLDREAPTQVKLTLRYANGDVQTSNLLIKQRHYVVEHVNGLPQATVTPNPELAARIAHEQEQANQARKHDDPREDFRHGFILPASGRISGVYGSQRIDNQVAKSPHYGLDIAVPTGTPIQAPAAGVVTLAEVDFFLTGGTVLIDHGFGLSSSFLHMSRLDVKVGQRVEQGQTIGAVGATGRASGPHLHWGFNWFDVRLDPALLTHQKSK